MVNINIFNMTLFSAKATYFQMSSEDLDIFISYLFIKSLSLLKLGNKMESFGVNK